MKNPRRRPSSSAVAALLLGLLGLLGTATACGASGEDDDGRGSAAPVEPSTVMQTSFPDLPAPTGEPTLAGIDAATPGVGDVVTVPGPFDDRFTLADLDVREGEVTGHLTIVSDVSDVLELQVLAGFYDAGGDFLGTGRATYHLDEATEDGSSTEGPPSELEEFTIKAPSRYAARVASAAVGVPVLVNE